MPSKKSLVRTIYLYLFALVGLGMTVAGCGRIVDVVLRKYIFTEADQRYAVPIEKPVGESEEEVVVEEQLDYVKMERQRDMAGAISQIIVGLPLYLYHWGVIKKDIKEQKE